MANWGHLESHLIKKRSFSIDLRYPHWPTAFKLGEGMLILLRLDARHSAELALSPPRQNKQYPRVWPFFFARPPHLLNPVFRFSGLSLLVLLISICVAIRRGQTQRHRQAIALASSLSMAPNRPSFHDMHLTTWAGPGATGATGAPTWCSVQVRIRFIVVVRS